MFGLSGSSGLEHRQNARMLEVARGDAFEVRTNTAQFGRHKTIYEMQTSIQPGKQLVLNLVMNRQRNFSTIWPNLSKINDAHQCNISAYGFERVLVWRVALDRQEDRMGLKAERAAKAKIYSFGRRDSCACDH
jgi:hypothetical protein